MILLQNPNMPVPVNAVEIDAAILDIKAHLESGLTWLTNGYGRTYKNLDARNGVTVFYPEAYLGEQNNSHRYINLSPDNDKQGQCFFYVVKETISQFQPGMYSFLSYDTAIIFSVNMELINDALLQTEIYQQVLVAQVRDVLTRQLMGSSYQLTISSVDFLFENVYSEFDLADAQQLEKAPLSHFRFNCTIKLPEVCPTPSIIPPVTTCYSLLLDGVNEYITTPLSVGIFDIGDSFSFSGWVKKTAGIYFPLFSKLFYPISSVQDGYRCYITSSEIVVNLYGLGNSNITVKSIGSVTTNQGTVLDFFNNRISWSIQSVPFASIKVRTFSTFSPNVWYNVTGTYDGTGIAGLKVYVDGVLEPTFIVFNNVVSSLVNTTPVTIGASADVLYGFNGKIASARIWDAELTSVQVAAEFNGGAILYPAVQGANLILNTDINNSIFNGSEWDIPDLTGITTGYESVNMEIGDRFEDCP